MKTLIIQVKVGNTSGYTYSDPNAPNLFDEHLVPTVKRYCEKYGYEYLNITEYPSDHNCRWFNFNTKPDDYDYSKGGKNKSATLIRYLNMNKDYDRIVSLDNDIWIPEHAEALPNVIGHHAVKDSGKTWDTFRKQNSLPFDTFVNGGVQMVNREAGTSLYSFIEQVCKLKTPPINGYHSDQGYMNYWRSQHKNLSYVLPDKWNHMVGCVPKPQDYSGVNFVHYAGDATRQHLKDDLKKGIIS
ncbi:hypothetical protein LCGC14_1017530 [marine sediment metagenome]|uniref:Nucleotide-diphospho-sugar transferase domain-containing protein n=1 Tax=marine sediment metagenome TaxID=412755 RepID=A0A0F9N322_9ZZZZ